MDPIDNPFAPGAGSPPPELVGRDPVLKQARVLFGRIKAGRAEKSMLLIGLRGVGKTVLLNQIERLAEDAGYRTISVEAHENKALGSLLVPQLKKLLFELNRLEGTKEKVRRGLAVLRSFIGSLKVMYEGVSFGLDIEPEIGAADSGDIESDLPNVFQAIAEAAADRGCSVALLIDEIQYLTNKELGALIMAMHRLQQRQLPMVLLGAGLPILPGLAGESKSYAERLFSFPSISALSEAEAAKALQEPAKAARVKFDSKSLKEIYRQTRGYPYFLQEWGYLAWNSAEASPIGIDVIKAASKKVFARLDENFFRVRFDRLTPGEKKFLRAMAQLGAGPHRIGDLAEVMGVKVTGLGPNRAKLIKKGMIYSPTYGEIAFTVPLFDRFMLRIMPGDDWQE